MGNNEADKLERLKRRLYTPQENLTSIRRGEFSPRETASTAAWSAPAATIPPRKKFWSPLVIVFFIALIFFLGAAGAAVYVLYRGNNVVSPANVELTVTGPDTVKAGEILTLQVLITNHNRLALEAVDLLAEYPAGTRAPADFNTPLTRQRWSLGTIGAGGLATQTIKAVVFGEKAVEREIRLKLEFRLADSNAIFDRLGIYRYRVSDSPLALAADWPTEVNAGQVLTLTLDLTNEAAATLENLAVKGDLPPGFIFQSSAPPALNGNFWRLGNLAPGARRRLALTGVVDGQDEEAKSFRFSVGSALNTGVTGEIDLVYGELFRTLTIKRPAISLALVLNGAPAAGEQAITSGELLRADITWANNLPTEVSDGRIEVQIKGAALDKRSVSTTDGFWQSADNLVIWRAGTKPALGRVAAGAGGQVSFTFATLPLVGSATGDPNQSWLENPSLELAVRFTGRRIAPAAPDETVETKIASRLKINSIFQLAAEAFYHDGPFANSGPLPPKVDTETTYTIVWTVINSSNTVREATVKATLPTYLRWLNVVSPASEKIIFNDTTGEVIWTLDVVEAGRGLATAAREAAFQVAFRPSLGQVEQSPTILTASTLTGLDTFTGQTLTYSRRALDTRLTRDTNFRPGDERVAN